MSTFLAANNAGTTLASTLSQTATTLAVSVGTGINFPQPNAALGQYFVMTLIPQTSTTGLPNEIVWVTQVVGDTMTIVRAQEGTSPLSFNVGDYAQNLWTAGQAESLVQASQAQAQSWNYGTDTGTANAGVVSLNPPLLSAGLTGVPIRVVKMGAANTGAYTLTVNGIGPIPVHLPGSSGNLSAGALPAGGIFQVIYDGTAFELVSTPGIIGISGNAGGDLTGTYPDPVVAQNAIQNSKLAQMLPFTIKMNNTNAEADPQDVSTSTFVADYVDPSLAAYLLISEFGSEFAATIPPYITPAALGFSESFANPGYQIFPGGFTIQWGPTGTIASHTPTVIDFPHEYANQCFGTLIVRTSTDDLNSGPDLVDSNSASSFTMTNSAANPLTFFYISVGH